MNIQQAIEKGYFPLIIPMVADWWILRIQLLSDTRSHFEGYQEDFDSYQDALDYGLLTIEELCKMN